MTVVAIGASAGGLEACRKLVVALPPDTGMAFVLVQHLDPTHESMMVDLLAHHTAMVVSQATDGARLQPDHLYVIPPGAYLSVENGALHLSAPEPRHGVRLPLDFLLSSLAAACGDRAACIVLSGTGADGSIGLRAVKERHGLVIAQDPDEADYDGMPRSAIATGRVDRVLPVADIPAALIAFDRRVPGPARTGPEPAPPPAGRLSEIVDVLRIGTGHDFSLYKPGTLERRIERRMALASMGAGEAARYLALLRSDAREVELLAKDLLINVTSFFRDRPVFDLLAEAVVPDMIRAHPAGQPFRVWIAGCSTGEEAYSFAMLLRECIAAAGRPIKLQIFASDVDADAVAAAREGLYPASIADDVSAGRLAACFIREPAGYRVTPDLRASVVFTVQDLLADPPFSRIDLISCRNLMIYLGSDAQSKVVSLFDFSLSRGGLLVLGSAEAIGDIDGRFEVLSKPARIYRHVGRSRPGDLGFLLGLGDAARAMARPGGARTPSRQAALAELCRRRVMEGHAPAAVLINRRYECLYSMGPTDRYLVVAPGYPSHDLFAMTPAGLHTKLRSAIQQAVTSGARVFVPGCPMIRHGAAVSITIAAEPVAHEGEDLVLVCLRDEPRGRDDRAEDRAPGEGVRVPELERELAETRAELLDAIRGLELSSEEQKAINEETLSVNEEYQSANEELLASKEELQSLNEELTALNAQLQETLERQRTTSADLQNVLYSTDVATIFLDPDLRIRFFTPATKALFSVIPSDVGRPLADLHALAADEALPADSMAVLRNSEPIERQIQARSNTWYLRRTQPYRTHDDTVAGVVITFTDITDRKRISDALEVAELQAQRANAAKSRFLAAASHDLRQPLQTLSLLQGLLAKNVESTKAKNLVARLDDTLGAMIDMLNTLLDIDQIESGSVRAEVVAFPIDDLLQRMRTEFAYGAEAQGLDLRVVGCGLVIESDPRLLEQIIRNLLANALKYTRRGKILLGCRRRPGRLDVEVWDTGIGIPGEEVQAIFEAYHQVDNAARERGRGLGLGLAIVSRLSDLLGHGISVRSNPGHGSVFTIQIAHVGGATLVQRDQDGPAAARRGAPHRTGAILIVEDDPDVRDLLELCLGSDGHDVATASDGPTAIDRVSRQGFRPDVVIADYGLPNGMNGLELVTELRRLLAWRVPIVMLTGETSKTILRDIGALDCVQVGKPVRSEAIARIIQGLLPQARAEAAPLPAPTAGRATAATAVIYVVDDDAHLRESIREFIESSGLSVETFATGEAFLEAYRPGREACLLIDANLPGLSGVELLQRLHAENHRLPSIMITGESDVAMAVQAMKAGARDFIEKPVGGAELLAAVERALEQSRDANKLFEWRETAADRMASLTARQREIIDLILAGHPNKNIAADLGISRRTVENHRAAIMSRTGAKSLPELARLALASAGAGPRPMPVDARKPRSEPAAG